MANEVTLSTLGVVVPAEVLGMEIRDSRQNRTVLEPLAKLSDLRNVAGITGTFPMSQSISFASVAETAAASNTAYTPTEATATAGQAAAKVHISDLARSGANPGTVDKIISELSRGSAQYVDTTLAALMGNNSANSVGSTTVNLTMATLDEAIVTAETNADEWGDKMLFVLHPRMLGDLRQDMLASSASPMVQRPDFSSTFGKGPGGAYKGDYNGYPVLQSNNVPTANAGADRAGCLMVAGEAFGLVINWDVRIVIESTRHDSMLGDAIVAYMSIGVGEVDEGMFVDIISDA